jgi:hypothetical protein
MDYGLFKHISGRPAFDSAFDFTFDKSSADKKSYACAVHVSPKLSPVAKNFGEGLNAGAWQGNKAA